MEYRHPVSAQLQIEDVTLRYSTRRSLVTAAYQVSFDVHRGERTILLGPSGCGKSSLLKAVGGFLRPTSGSIRLNGRPITAPGPDRMMVFQEFDQLLPWKTVTGNVMFALRKGAGLATSAARLRAAAAISAVRLDRFADAYPHELSGGMKQRVAIARAMAMQPELLLMDEPFAALDALTRQQMQDELIRLWRETGFSLLFVTHSIEEAIIVGSRIVVLSPHPGRVRAEIDVRDVTEADRASAKFQSLRARIDALLFDDQRAAADA